MGVKIDKGIHKGIPYLAYKGDHAKRLLFVQHGIYGNKEKWMQVMGVPFANLGYHVVATDARKHGERKEDPFLSPNYPHGELQIQHIIPGSAEDIRTLFTDKFPSYKATDYLGISMGGMIGYQLMMMSDIVDVFYGVITTPNMRALFEATHPQVVKDYPKEINALEKAIETINPAAYATKMSFGEIHMFHGNLDDVVPIDSVEAFYQTHQSWPISLEVFDADHHLTPPMFEAIKERLKSHL
jgi:esterase/lipase